MSKDHIVRPYQPGDEESIVKLLELVFGGWPHFDLKCTPLEHWKWKFGDNPLKMNTIVVGISNNRIIGCMHYIYQRIKIGKKSLLSGQGMDLAVHPDFRVRGVYLKMGELKDELIAKDNVNIVYGATVNPIVIRRSNKLGWLRFPRPVLCLVRIHNFDLHLKMMSKRARLKKYGYHLLKAVNRIRNILSRPPIVTSEFQVKEINSFDDRIELFWNRIKDHYSFIVERSKEYLNWRYCDPRGGDYLVKQVEEEGHIIGYSVLRINKYKEDYPRGYVVDLLTLPDRLDVADTLINDAVHYFDDLRVNIVYYCVVKNHLYERLFKRHEFLDSRTDLYVSYNPIQVETEIDEFKTTPSKQLHFQYGDTDAI